MKRQQIEEHKQKTQKYTSGEKFHPEGPRGAEARRNQTNIFFHIKNIKYDTSEDGGEIGGSRVHFPSGPVKRLADLRNRVNSQRYSSIYEDQRPKIVEDIEKSDGKKSA